MLAVRALPRRRPAGWRERARGGEAFLLPLRAAARRAAPAVGRAGRGVLRPGRARRRARRAAAHAAADRPQPHGDAARHGRRAAGAPARAAAARHVLLRRGGRGRRPRDGRRHRCSRCSSSTSAARRAGSRTSRSARSRSADAPQRDRRMSLADVEALLFLSPEPVSRRGAAPTPLRAGRGGGARRADRAARRPRRPRRRAARGRRRLALASHPDAEEAARRLLARPRTPGADARPRPRRWRSSPTCSRSRGRRWPASAASPRSRRPPRCVERGLIEEAGRSQFGAVLYRTTPLFLKLFGLRSLEELPELAQWDPTPGGARPRCATACCARARRAAKPPPPAETRIAAAGAEMQARCATST